MSGHSAGYLPRMLHFMLWIAVPPHGRYSALKIAFPGSTADLECGVDDLMGYLRQCFASAVALQLLLLRMDYLGLDGSLKVTSC